MNRVASFRIQDVERGLVVVEGVEVLQILIIATILFEFGERYLLPQQLLLGISFLATLVVLRKGEMVKHFLVEHEAWQIKYTASRHNLLLLINRKRFLNGHYLLFYKAGVENVLPCLSFELRAVGLGHGCRDEGLHILLPNILPKDNLPEHVLEKLLA